jgi:putative SOS response-associated peptidase YedK
VIRRLAKRPADASQEASLLEDGTNEFTELRWGFPPAQPKRPPVINFRSEGRRFPVGRCLVRASHFFEFTGTKSPKTKWKFKKAGEDWFCFAGLWRPMPAGGAAFTLLTTDPSPDVAPIHGRQMVILDAVRCCLADGCQGGKPWRLQNGCPSMPQGFRGSQLSARWSGVIR